jgi:pimeloyl-ACP methyl ester carboxylesterase
VLLFESGWVSHLVLQLELFSFGSVVECLTDRFTVIRYDKPGCGLSDRDGIDLLFDGQVAAALAVADAVGAGRCVLSGRRKCDLDSVHGRAGPHVAGRSRVEGVDVRVLGLESWPAALR